MYGFYYSQHLLHKYLVVVQTKDTDSNLVFHYDARNCCSVMNVLNFKTSP